ncbi:putative ABC transport system ATP-binding protein [Caldalkalibacillus uzonensis]|uniref:ABC transport system ATP-binding protein n=1 Tax=Caldalkalibacillus uzonensis TaxID=353224 RepID=A0ABU0CNQ8_9BACI|nr:ABC transporter ATP-binding protein [Caldalkalibacillus uzonensis]MDQ0338045.1 putative ABC transport system ATP-binding protein [Caldalkalibacillus uzonensis]
MSETIINIQNLTKTYQVGGEVVHALRDVSLQVKTGEFLAIMGPSGSGKSTLMNIIGCLDRPDSGQYILDGKEIDKLSENELAIVRNKKIGFVFQNFNLLSHMTALENVELPLLYRGMRTKERKMVAYECLQKVGLEERAHHLPNQLSGGQQQRVAIARALVGHPPILLADEPTGVLDSKTGLEIIAVIKSLNEQGHTIIVITHDPSVAEHSKRVVYLRDGQLFQERGDLIGSLPVH